MTNMLGQVIFVDQVCLRLLKRHHHEARTIIGKSLHDVLGFDRATTEGLLGEIASAGKISDWELVVRDSGRSPIPVLLSAVATRDDKGNFVGADVSLHPIFDAASAPTMTNFDTVDEKLDTMEETYLQTYFKAQIEGVQALLVQLGGVRLGRNLETIINETAERNVWPVSMKDGNITVQLRKSDADIYRALLAKAVAYAVKMIGKKVVARQIETAEKRLDPRVLEFVGELGLRELFNVL
jgi:hypothetical protein